MSRSSPGRRRSVDEPDVGDVRGAGVLLARHLEPTPVIASPRPGEQVRLKLETLQPTGSFKIRGAFVAVAAAKARDPLGRVVTASAGNHGLGVAFAARVLGVQATVVLPVNASPAKQALERFEVDAIRHGRSYEEAEARALELADQGAHFVSAYNDPDVIAGQGTIALELFDQVPGLTTIVAPVGGGGLLAGLALAASGRDDVGVRGVEADSSPAISAAVAAGHVVAVPIAPTLADGLTGNIEPGSITVSLIARMVDGLGGAAEDAIAEAVRFLAAEHGLVVEPSGAVAVAALLSGRMQPGPGPAVVVVSGRNVSSSLFCELLSDRP